MSKHALLTPALVAQPRDNVRANIQRQLRRLVEFNGRHPAEYNETGSRVPIRCHRIRILPADKSRARIVGNTAVRKVVTGERGRHCGRSIEHGMTAVARISKFRQTGIAQNCVKW